ncbi:MAG: AAA family ATPase [Bacteroidales bacterium]|nr:AAA family ATPase [Bacteroidales bacterium]
MAAEGYLIEKIREKLGFEPTTCQQRLIESLAHFTIEYGTCDLMLVSGYAGTGKTSAIAAYVKTLKEHRHRFVLLAPTGRAAKVLSGFTREQAFTIHKHIYRQKSINAGFGEFELDINKHKETIFIVDEASLISTSGGQQNIFGSGDLLSDLITYLRAGVDNKLILIGDKGQLPPIGLTYSPALDESYMGRYGNVKSVELTTVVRQAADSGILSNATAIRLLLGSNGPMMPQLRTKGFEDVIRIHGGELIESLSDMFDKYGTDEVVVLCRSNKRANRYNMGIRSSVLYLEEQLTRGDKLMVVKNCYQFLEDVPELDFIANGDVVELVRIYGYEERYGLNFAEAVLSFPDYNDVEITAKIILDTLHSESAALSEEQQRILYEGVNEDYAHVKGKRKRYSSVREDKYFNALQIKYASAITGHKSQGGQWKCVFIDNPFWKEPTEDDLKWLYTAITRGVERVYFINFKDEFFID